MANANSYIASEAQVEAFLSDLRNVLSHNDCEVDILPKKKDEAPEDPFTTENTMLDLDFDVDDVISQLKTLTKKEYIENIKDSKGTSYPDFWVFGRDINSKAIYIKVKIRDKKTRKVFCVSFHYARFNLKQGPY